jgi:hypothetical protein
VWSTSLFLVGHFTHAGFGCGGQTQTDPATKAFFNASIVCVVGNGKSTLFWSDPWLEGKSLANLMPELVEATTAGLYTDSGMPTHGGIGVDSWRQGCTFRTILSQYLHLRQRLQDRNLSQDEDWVLWCWSTSGQYSARSAYQAMFVGQTAILGAKEIWKTKAPSKYKFFLWLLVLDMCWTAVRHQRHGLQDSETCVLCDQEVETYGHIAVHCVFTREVWVQVLSGFGWQALAPTDQFGLAPWWLQVRKSIARVAEGLRLCGSPRCLVSLA